MSLHDHRISRETRSNKRHFSYIKTKCLPIGRVNYSYFGVIYHKKQIMCFTYALLPIIMICKINWNILLLQKRVEVPFSPFDRTHKIITASNINNQRTTLIVRILPTLSPTLFSCQFLFFLLLHKIIDTAGGVLPFESLFFPFQDCFLLLLLLFSSS